MTCSAAAADLSFVDGDRTRMLITPRRAGSNCAAVNEQRIARLTTAGPVTSAGLVAVERRALMA